MMLMMFLVERLLEWASAIRWMPNGVKGSGGSYSNVW